MFRKMRENLGIACLALSSLSFSAGCHSERKDNEPRIIKAPILLQKLKDLNAEMSVQQGVRLVAQLSDSRVVNPARHAALSEELASLLGKLNVELGAVSDEGKSNILGVIGDLKAVIGDLTDDAKKKNLIKFLEAAKAKLENSPGIDISQLKL